MLRTCIGSLLVLALSTAALRSAEIEGQIKRVDADKGIITITIEDKDQDFTITDDTKILVNDVARQYEPKEWLKDPVFKLKRLRARVTTEKKGNKEVVTKLIVDTGRKG
jgi:hypothetical protein